LILLASNTGDLVIDMFAGSGSVGRACLNTDRQFRLGDINTKEILKRLG
jgi:DNA modification methylase